MIRILIAVSLALLLSALLQVQDSVAENPSSGRSLSKETSADSKGAQSPRQFIESRLNGKIVRLERDPEASGRAVLFVDRKDSVTQHVLEVGLNSETNLRDIRILTPDGNSVGVPPVIIMPRSLVSPCGFQCKDKCGRETDCLAGCMFDCIVD